ncbi:MAG TPA: hypothetical protein VF984_09245 [Actinomycetota bacterium]
MGFAADQLRSAGFHILQAREADTPIAFLDLAAVVYYLRAVPWAVEGFDPVADREALESIHRRIQHDGRLLIRGSHLLLEAVVGTGSAS